MFSFSSEQRANIWWFDFLRWLLLQGKYVFPAQILLLANQKAYQLLNNGCDREKSLGFCFQRYENK